MNDRELLELAAKAAGIVINADRQAERDALNIEEPIGLWTRTQTNWNPIFNDGDALRLASRLTIDIESGTGYAQATWYEEDLSETHSTLLYFDFEEDRLPTIRRVVTMAAADIGKSK